MIPGEANLPERDDRLGKAWHPPRRNGPVGGHPVSTSDEHGCVTEGPHRCDGVECGDNDKGQRYMGVCDKDGCDYNPYRARGNSTGRARSLGHVQPLTVVTQFLTDDGTDAGTLVEVRRHYIQDGKRVSNPSASAEYGSYDSISDKQCAAQKKAFGEFDDFTPKGGLKAMGEAMERGMVLVLSLWDDASDHMIWLDATDPPPEQGQPPKKERRGARFVASATRRAAKAHPYAQVTLGKIRSATQHDGRPAAAAIAARTAERRPPRRHACRAYLCPASPPAAYRRAECAALCAKQKMKG